MIRTASLLIVVLLPALLQAQEPQTIRVVLKNTSMFRQTLLVRDDVCPAAPDSDCVLAESLRDSDECRREPNLERCRDARRLLDSEQCVDGVTRSATLEPGDTLSLAICRPAAGHGQISVRSRNSGRWVRHLWLRDGDTVNAP